MELENLITINGETQEDVIQWNPLKTEEKNILHTIIYITNIYRKKYVSKILLQDALSNQYTEEKAIRLKNPNLFVFLVDKKTVLDKAINKDFKNIFHIGGIGAEQKVLIEKFKKGKKTENVTMDFDTISKINTNFEETFLKFMNNAASLQEKEDMIGFQTKSNFKVAGNDGKSQFNFLQLAEKRQVDLSSISLKEYTLEEISQHKTEESTWMVVNEKIYDITIYKKYHPGGLEKIMMGAGKDATSLIFKYHPWVNVHNILEKYQVGIVIKKK